MLTVKCSWLDAFFASADRMYASCLFLCLFSGCIARCCCPSPFCTFEVPLVSMRPHKGTVTSKTLHRGGAFAGRAPLFGKVDITMSVGVEQAFSVVQELHAQSVLGNPRYSSPCLLNDTTDACWTPSGCGVQNEAESGAALAAKEAAIADQALAVEAAEKAAKAAEEEHERLQTEYQGMCAGVATGKEDSQTLTDRVRLSPPGLVRNRGRASGGR